MSELKKVWLCTRLNFSKWPVNPRIYTVGVIIVAFNIWNTSGLMEYTDFIGQKITPWIFPHMFSPVMIVAYGCFTALLFSDAPFADSHVPFVIVRCGRLVWILGQIIYLFLTSLILTTFQLLTSTFLLLSQMTLSFEWGIVMKTLASNPSVIFEAGINSAIGISPSIVSQFSPITATITAFVLCWLVTSFSGMIILSANVIIGKNSGLVLLSWFIFFSYFSLYLGRLTLASWLFYLSPLSWGSMDFIDWSGVYRSILPSPQYVFISLIGSILLMSYTSIRAFCTNDIDFPDGGI